MDFDYTFWNIVRFIFGERPHCHRQDPGSIIRQLPMEELQEENQEIPEPLYTGKPAKFVNSHGQGIRRKRIGKSFLVQMELISDTPNSLLRIKKYIAESI